MSIHKSKGLEFPVVFLSSTGKQFNLMDLNKSILLHQEMGIGVKYIDYEKQIQYDTLSKAAIRNKVFIETLAEEMRILYVALTRAKEKLIITKDYEKLIDKMIQQIEQYPKQDNKINHILLKKYKKYLDWILLVYLYEKENIKDYVELNIYNKTELLNKLVKQDKEEVDVIKLLEENKVEQEKLEKIEKIMQEEYRYKNSISIPNKTTVTELKQLNNKVIRKEASFDLPKFMKNEVQETLTGAQKGTVLHLCMQKLEIGREYNIKEIKELINDLKEREIITKLEAESVNINAILKFTKSKIWEELKNAKEIHREESFYMTIPAKEIYNKELDEKIVVQGIIDLYYINSNNELVLLDYKTDYVENGEEELIQKYKNQLQLYKKALEKSLNKKVDKIYIYSTYLGKEIEI